MREEDAWSVPFHSAPSKVCALVRFCLVRRYRSRKNTPTETSHLGIPGGSPGSALQRETDGEESLERDGCDDVRAVHTAPLQQNKGCKFHWARTRVLVSWNLTEHLLLRLSRGGGGIHTSPADQK